MCTALTHLEDPLHRLLFLAALGSACHATPVVVKWLACVVACTYLSLHCPYGVSAWHWCGSAQASLTNRWVGELCSCAAVAPAPGGPSGGRYQCLEWGRFGVDGGCFGDLLGTGLPRTGAARAV